MYERYGRMIADLRAGRLDVESVFKGDLRVIAIRLGIAELRASDCVFLLDGRPAAYPGKRMTRGKVALLRHRVAEEVAR